MRTTLATLTVLVMWAVAGALNSTSAHVAPTSHDTGPAGPCVTANDLKAVERGWTRHQVTKRFGYVGVAVDYRKLGGLSDIDHTYREQSVRAYPGCRGAMGVFVGFERRTIDNTVGTWRVVKVRSMSLLSSARIPWL